MPDAESSEGAVQSPDTVEKALEEDYRPDTIGDPPEDAEWSDYAWASIPCPYCDKGMLVGIYDPDYQWDGETGHMALLRPPEDEHDA